MIFAGAQVAAFADNLEALRDYATDPRAMKFSSRPANFSGGAPGFSADSDMRETVTKKLTGKTKCGRERLKPKTKVKINSEREHETCGHGHGHGYCHRHRHRHRDMKRAVTVTVTVTVVTVTVTVRETP